MLNHLEIRCLEQAPEQVLIGRQLVMARRMTITAGLKHVSGIYAIRLDVDGRSYVGSATSLKTRIGQHRCLLRSDRHDNSYLQRAWSKYGEVSFSFWLLSVCNKGLLSVQEGIFMGDTGVCTRSLGFNLDEIAIRKSHSEETKQKIRIANTGRLLSSETRAKISKAHLGRKHPPRTVEQRLHHRLARLGRKVSLESRAKMSASRMGRIITPEWRKRISLATTGKKKSEETRAKMRAAQARRKHQRAQETECLL